LQLLRDVFPQLQVHGYQLLAMLGRVVKQRQLAFGLAWCDDVLLRRLPTWQRYCRYLVLALQKGDQEGHEARQEKTRHFSY
jgi:hypothetical protein